MQVIWFAAAFIRGCFDMLSKYFKTYQTNPENTPFDRIKESAILLLQIPRTGIFDGPGALKNLSLGLTL